MVRNLNNKSYFAKPIFWRILAIDKSDCLVFSISRTLEMKGVSGSFNKTRWLTFVRLRKPTEYGSLDSKPVDLLAFMISPENSGDDYLQTLSAFSQALRNENICKLIRRAKSAHEIYVALQG